MTTIPLSQIVDVIPSVLGAGGAAIDLNGLVLTNNARVPIGTVRSFGSVEAVEDFFGASDPLALSAPVYFNGYDGSTKKPGALLMAQYPVEDVPAYLRGGDVSDLTLDELKAISGTLAVVADGVTITVGSLTLAAASSFSSAAAIIEADIGAAIPSAASVTGSIGGVVTASAGAAFTGTGSGTNLTVASIAGVLHPGAAISGTGVPSGTYIVSQTSGSAGGDGVYVTNHATTSSGDALVAISNILDVTAVSSGTLQPTDAISGTGLATGTTILAQISGGAGSTGTYAISSQQHVASATVTSLSSILNVTAVGSGAIEVGGVISGTNVTVGSTVTSNGTGSGGIGTYHLSASSTTVSETIAADVAAPTVAYDSVSGGFVLTSGTDGATSSFAFATGTASAALKLTSATGAATSQGSAAATPAAFMAAVIALTQNWALFMTAFDPDETGFANREAFSAWANSTGNRYGYVPRDSDASPTVDVPATSCFMYAVTQAGYSGTIPVWEPSDINHDWFVLGWAASLDFEQTNGRATLDFRSQSGLVAGVTDGQVAINLGGNPQVVGDRGNGYNFYGVYGAGNDDEVFMARGFVSGPFRWADSYVIQIWLNNSLQAALTAYLRAVGSTPFNQAGYTAIEESMSDAIQAGANFGAFVPGVTLSASQIAAVNAAAGRNIATTLQNRGWYVLVSAASPTTRASRGPLRVTFWYVDGQSVQSISLSSVAVQ